MRETMLAMIMAAGLFAQAAPNPDEVLEQVRQKLRTMMHGLPRYTCVQTVERRYSRREVRKGETSCDQIMGERKTRKAQLYATDRLRLDVAIAGGQEIVSWAGAGKFDSRSVDEVVGEGPTGTGSFGGHVVDVFSNSGTHFRFVGEKTANGKKVLEYHFTVPRDASNYRIHGDEGWHIAAYDGTFEIDAETAHLERLDLRTEQLTADTTMCEASTSLEYQYLRIGGADFLLPRLSELQIVQTDGFETVNDTRYSSCREYHTESTIRFDDETSDGGAAAAAEEAAAFKALPEGLPVSLALTGPIDTRTAAAGDPVSARVLRAVKEPKTKAQLIPAGAVVHGRLARVRYRVPSNDVVVLISFDSLELKRGAAVPLSLKLDSVAQLERAQLMSGGRRTPRAPANQGPETWGALIVPAFDGRASIPAGYQSEWLTAALKGPKN